jgi:HEPN domain-containing protein
MKHFTTRHGFNVSDLLYAATDHLASAGVLFDKNPRCYDSAGYLSHLGIELILKAFLLHYTGQFPAEHSLRKLRCSLEERGITLLPVEKYGSTLAKLDRFADLRYPNPNGAPEIGSDDWTIICTLYSQLRTQLPTDLQRQVDRISQTKKFGRILMRKRKDT